MKKRLIASLVISISLGGLGIANNASAKTLDKDGLLKTNKGKVVMGYHVFEGKLYKNGRLSKGYAVIGKGAKAKLYYNGSLKKGYKTAQKKTLLFKDGVLVKGYKQAGKNERLYKNGRLATGYRVHKMADGTTYLYQHGVLKKGQKTVTRDGVTTLYVDGQLAKGLLTAKGQLFKDGQLASGIETYKEKIYQNGQLFTGDLGYLTYESGVAKSEAQVQKLAASTEKMNELSERQLLILDAIGSYYEMNKQLNEKYKGFMLQSVLDEVTFDGKLETPYYGALADMKNLVDDDFTQGQFNEQFQRYYSQLVGLVNELLSIQNQLLEETTVVSMHYEMLQESDKELTDKEMAMFEQIRSQLENKTILYSDLLGQLVMDENVKLPILKGNKVGADMKKFSVPREPMPSIFDTPWLSNVPYLLAGASILSVFPNNNTSSTNTNTPFYVPNLPNFSNQPITLNTSFAKIANKSFIVSNDGAVPDKELILNYFKGILKAEEVLSWASNDVNNYNLNLSSWQFGQLSITKTADAGYVKAIPSSYTVKSEKAVVQTIKDNVKKNALFNDFTVDVTKKSEGRYLVKATATKNNQVILVQKVVDVKIEKDEERLEEALDRIPSKFSTNDKALIEADIAKLIDNPDIKVSISNVAGNHFAYTVSLTLNAKVANKTVIVPKVYEHSLEQVASLLANEYSVTMPPVGNVVVEDVLKGQIQTMLHSYQLLDIVIGNVTKKSDGTYDVLLERDGKSYTKNVSVAIVDILNDTVKVGDLELLITSKQPVETPDNPNTMFDVVGMKYLSSAMGHVETFYMLKANISEKQQLESLISSTLSTSHPGVNVRVSNSTIQNQFDVILTYNNHKWSKRVFVTIEPMSIAPEPNKNEHLLVLTKALSKISGVYELEEGADEAARVKELVEAEISDTSITVVVENGVVYLSKGNLLPLMRPYTVTVKPDVDKVALEAARAKLSGSYELEEGADEAAGVKKLVEAEISDASIRVSVAGKKVTLSKNGKEVTKDYEVIFKPDADKVALEAARAKVSGSYELEEGADEAAGVKKLVEAEISDASIRVSVAGKKVTLSKNGKEVTKGYEVIFKPDADKVALEAARAKVSGSYELEEGADEVAGVKKLVEAEISDASIRVSVAGKKVTLSKNGKEVTKDYEVIFKPDADKVALEAALSKVKGSYSFAYDTSSLTAAVKNAIEQAISDATISVSVASDYTVTLARNGKSVSKSVSVTREDKPYVPETVTAATVQQAASQIQLPAEMVLPANAYTQAQQRALLLAEAKKKLGSNYSVAIKSFKFVQPVSALSKVKAKVAESEGPQYLTVAVTFDVSRSGYTATTSELQTKFLVTDEMKEAAFAAIQQAMKQPHTDFTKVHPGLQMMLDVAGIFELDLDSYEEIQYPTYIGEFRLNDFIGAGIEGFTSRFNEFTMTQKSNEDGLVEEVQSIVDGTSSYSLYEVYGWFANNFSYSLMDENANEPFALSNEEVSALIMKKIGQKDITVPVLIEAYLAAQPGAEEASAFIKEKEAAFKTLTDKSQLIDFYKQIDELSPDAKWLLKDEALDLRYDQTLANSWAQIWLHEFFLNDLNDVEYEEALLDLADENDGTKLPGQYPEHINKDIYVPLLRDAVAALTPDERDMLEVELQRTGYGSIEDYLALFTGI